MSAITRFCSVSAAALTLATFGTAARAQLLLPAEGQIPFDSSVWVAPDIEVSLVVDLNHDGYLDLVGAGLDVRTALNNGQSVFLPVGVSDPIALADDIAHGDLDNDGDVDIVVCGTAGGGHVTTLLGDGNGSLVMTTTVVVPAAEAIALADFDLDGNLDVVVSHDEAGLDGHVLLGNGDGTLGSPTPFGTGGSVQDIDAADWDLDGDPDVVVAGSPTARLFLWNGTELVDTHDLGQGSSFVCLADVTADGRPDILHLNRHPFGDSRLYYHINTGGPPALSGSVSIFGVGEGIGVEDVPVGEFPSIWVASFDNIFSFGSQLLTRVIANGFGLLDFGGAGALGFKGSLHVADFDNDGVADVATSSSNTVTVRFDTGSSLIDPPITPLWDFPGSTSGLVHADLDGDGFIDLVGIDQNQGVVAVSLGTEGGAFGPWTKLGGAGSPRDLALADADGDDVLDAFVLSDNLFTGPNDATIAVRRGDGAGAFTTIVTTQLNLDAQAFAVGDLDDDGTPDAVVVGPSASGSKLSTWLGNGFGSFASGASVEIGSDGVVVALGDVNGDGALDAVALRHDEDQLPIGEIVVALGDGAGGLGTPTTIAQSVQPSTNLVLGDVNADSALDIAVGSSSDDGSIALLLGDGLGGFTESARGGMAGAVISGMIAADIDDDGHVDIAQSSGSAVIVARGDGQGGLITATGHRSRGSSALKNLVAADVDLDGRTDLVQLGFNGVATLLRQRDGDSPWASIGGGVAGAAGQPRIKGRSSFVPGSPIAMDTVDAPPSATAFLIVGTTLVDVPFKSGHLVPSLDVLIGPLASDVDGDLNLSGPWPAGVPSDTEFWFQAWLVDATAPVGFAGTGGLRLTVP